MAEGMRLKAAGAAIWLAAAAAVPVSAERIHSRAGTSSAAFLKVGVGARPIAMGEAHTAAEAGVDSIYWNPAALAGTATRDIGYTFHDSFQDLRHDFLGYSQPWRGSVFKAPGAAVGFGINSFRVPSDLERRSGANEDPTPGPDITAPEGTFGASDLSLHFAYARFLSTYAAAGGSLKYIRQAIDDESATTFALDLGWRLKEWRRNLDIGAVLLNLGPGVKFGTRFPLPLTFKAGGRYSLPRRDARLLFDMSLPRDNYPILSVGGEARIHPHFQFRTGYRYRWYGNPLGVLSGFRTGLGFNYGPFTMDYAFAPFGELGKTHRISLGWRFEPGRRGSRPAKAETPALPAEPPPLPPPLPVTAEIQPAADFTAMETKVDVKILSARGGVFDVRAKAPEDDWELRSVAFLAVGPTMEGFAFAALRDAEPASLPENRSSGIVYKFRMNQSPALRAVQLSVRAPSKKSSPKAWGLFGTVWQELPAERNEAGGDLWNIRADGLPEAFALAFD